MPAWYSRLDGYPVADFECFDAWMDRDHLTSRLVAEDVVSRNYHGTYTAMLPEVDV